MTSTPTPGLAASRPRPSLSELYARGKSLRSTCHRSAHAGWVAPADRPDPLSLLARSNRGRLPELVPIRHGRMLKSPFTFFRGAALNMAADLARTPVSGMRVQACGDCHLLNFGAYATPERRHVFDINDLDETLPAPWEWDVKRLAASLVLACRSTGFSAGAARDAALACVGSYRRRMAEYSDMTVLEVWYASMDVDKLLKLIKDKEAGREAERRVAAARARDVREHDFPKLAAARGQVPLIKDNPPLIYHPTGEGEHDLLTRGRLAWAGYRRSLQDDRRALLDRYELKDVAIKVVGVGSVGTYCCIMLLMASEKDPLFLQVKEAQASVLAPYVDYKMPFTNNGQRVVVGQRLIQGSPDIFLGWGEADGRHFYVRQLADMKGGIKLDENDAVALGAFNHYCMLCGWALALAHAKSGDPAMIAGYCGNSDALDDAIAKFGAAYAKQTERDHATLEKARRSGRIRVAAEALIK